MTRYRANVPADPTTEVHEAPSLTLGIEEEYQIIDPETRELKSYITEILQGDKVILDEVKPELHQSMVEIGSKVCRTPRSCARARAPARHGDGSRRAKRARHRRGGHASVLVWTEQEITPLERYIGVKAGSRRTSRSSC